MGLTLQFNADNSWKVEKKFNWYLSWLKHFKNTFAQDSLWNKINLEKEIWIKWGFLDN